MKEKLEVSCPVSAERINENVVRIVAGYVIVFITFSILLNNYLLSSFVLIDFALRAFNLSRYSALKALAVKTGRRFHVKQKPTDAAPKKFAALLGVIFTFMIVAAQLLHLKTVAVAAGSILLFCAFLESVFGICLGCHVYSFIKKYL